MGVRYNAGFAVMRGSLKQGFHCNRGFTVIWGCAVMGGSLQYWILWLGMDGPLPPNDDFEQASTCSIIWYKSSSQYILTSRKFFLEIELLEACATQPFLFLEFYIIIMPMGAVIMLNIHHLEIIIIIYYKLYGNKSILYIIDRLWKAGLLLKNHQKYEALQSFSVLFFPLISCIIMKKNMDLYGIAMVNYLCFEANGCVREVRNK